MTESTQNQKAAAERESASPRSKMTIRVYTVDRYGTVKTPRATVSVPHDFEPAGEALNPNWGPCACPRHSGGAR